MSFTWKATARNLFRYQRRFWMTVIGIGGCNHPCSSRASACAIPFTTFWISSTMRFPPTPPGGSVDDVTNDDDRDRPGPGRERPRGRVDARLQ